MAQSGCRGGGDDELPTAEICGRDGAHRILDLAAEDEVERVVGSDPATILFGVVTAPAPDSGLPPSARTPKSVVLGDGCGQTLDAIADVRLVTASGVAPMACADDEVFVVDDPPGETIGAVGCRLGSVDLGLVVEAPGERGLWLHPPEAPPRAVVQGLAADDAGDRWTAGGGTIVARTDDGSIVVVAVPASIVDAFETATVATGAVDFRVGGDARWLVWQGAGEDGMGPILRTDLHGEAADVELATARLADEPLALYGPYLVLRTDAGRELFRLEDAKRIVLPQGTSFRRHLDDGRLWLHRDAAPYGELDELAWDPNTGRAVTVYAGPGATTYADDGLEVHVPSPDAGIQLGQLRLAPWDGSGARVLGDDVGWHRRRLDDGRVLSVVQTSDDPPLGTLVLHERARDGPLPLADEVLATSLRINPGVGGGGGHPFEGDFLWVGAHDGARALWRIRIPPPLSPGGSGP